MIELLQIILIITTTIARGAYLPVAFQFDLFRSCLIRDSFDSIVVNLKVFSFRDITFPGENLPYSASNSFYNTRQKALVFFLTQCNYSTNEMRPNLK